MRDLIFKAEPFPGPNSLIKSLLPWVRKLHFSNASCSLPKPERCSRTGKFTFRATDYENPAGTCQVMKVVYFILFFTNLQAR